MLSTSLQNSINWFFKWSHIYNTWPWDNVIIYALITAQVTITLTRYPNCELLQFIASYNGIKGNTILTSLITLRVICKILYSTCKLLNQLLQIYGKYTTAVFQCKLFPVRYNRADNKLTRSKAFDESSIQHHCYWYNNW